MKALFFDAGPVITLVLSRMGWLLPKLKEKFGGEFYITPAVKYELVDRPLTTKRFQLEALEVMKMIREGVFTIYDKVPEKKVNALKNLANSSFKLGNKNMDVIQAGEMESVACALQINAAVVMDERTLRLFIENNSEMQSLLEHRFKKKVTAHHEKMNFFSEQLKGITIIRSIELVAVAYKRGLLNSYIPPLKNGKSSLLKAVFWATKFNGCAVTEHEIIELEKYILKMN
jgi:hypothetical protein